MGCDSESDQEALGADQALSPNRIGDHPNRLPPVQIHRTPMTWLQAGCDGLVILYSATARDELWDVRELRGEDFDHGQQLRAMMRVPPWRGRICIPAEATAA